MASTTVPAGRGVPATDDGSTKTRSGPNPLVRAILIGVGVIALLVAIVYGVKFIAYSSTHETTDDATIDADVVQINSKISERVDHIYVDTNQAVKKGQLLVSLENSSERDSYNQAAAAVAAQEAQASAARANVTLAIDTQAAQNLENRGGIEQASAGITSADAQAQSADQQIAVATAGAASAQAQLIAAQAALPGALQTLKKNAADLARTQSLVSTGDEPKAQLDAARATYAGARSEYSQAQANVNAAQAEFDQANQKVTSQRYSAQGTQSQVGVQQGQLTTARGKLAESGAPSRIAAQQASAQAAEAQVASLKAQLATANTNLGYTHLVSPINGYVGEKNVEVGQTVGVGQSLMTLVPSSNVYITANYKETQIGEMHVNQEVDISIDAYKGKNFVGHVQDLAPASQNTFSLVPAQNATGNFVKVTQRLPVRILVDKVENGNLSDYPLRPGMSVETSVKVK